MLVTCYEIVSNNNNNNNKGDVVHSVCRRIVSLRIVSLSSITRMLVVDNQSLSCPSRDSCGAPGKHNMNYLKRYERGDAKHRNNLVWLN